MSLETLLLLVLTASVVLLAFLGLLFAFRQTKEQGAGEVPQRFPDPVPELESRLDQLELRFGTLIQEVKDREAYAIGALKKARAAQRRVEELEGLEEFEGLPGPDANGGTGQGVLPLHTPVDDSEQRLAAARAAVAFRGRR